MEESMENTVLCASSAYERKYYLNPDFETLPSQIQDELQILCVLFTEENGGIFTIEFQEDGTLFLRTEALESDAMYDEIGAALRIKELRREKEELFTSLEMFYKVFVLGDEL